MFKDLEAIPLYGDMQIAPFQYVTLNDPTYDSGKWPLCNSESTGRQARLAEHLPTYREQHLRYTTELAKHHLESFTLPQDREKRDEKVREIYDLAYRGLKLVSSWTSKLMEVYSWKLFHPADHHSNQQCPTDAEDYERAIRYNLTSSEKYAFIEVITMIKELQKKLRGHSSAIDVAVRTAIYTDLQEFTQVSLRDPLRKAVKSKKELIQRIIASIRATCDDTLENEATDKAAQGKKDEKGFQVKVERRTVPPSTSQIYLLKTMLESLINQGTLSSKTNLRKDIDSGSVATMEKFHTNMLYWHYMINFNDSLSQCCELAQFWYREIFLEMMMGKRVQFPIEMSMPWILVDHIVAEMHPSMCESIFYILDLYNDSANYALKKFKKQHLFDEVEAEVQLCFDQLLYKISKQIFAYYKYQAGNMYLERCLKSEAKVKKSKKKVVGGKSIRFISLIKQRHIQLLGRSLDLNFLIGSRVTEEFKTSLNIAISRFEAADLTGIMELEGLIEVNRLTHRLMREHINLTDFDLLLKEADHNVYSPYGRIALHVFWELNYDILPCFCYCSGANRFIRGDISFADELERERAPTTTPTYLWGSRNLKRGYTAMFLPYTKFLGAPHIQVICRLVGEIGISLIVSELVKVISSLCKSPGHIKQYLTVLMKGLPNKLKLQRWEYKASGNMSYFIDQTKEILQHMDLKTVVFQSFREFGNAIIFCRLLDNCMAAEKAFTFNHSMMMRNVIPLPNYPQDPSGFPERNPPPKPKEDVQKKKKENWNKIKGIREKKYRRFHLAPLLKKRGTEEQVQVVEEMDNFFSTMPHRDSEIFPNLLRKVTEIVKGDSFWDGDPPENEVIETEKCNDFQRMWSVMQLAFCLPIKKTEYSAEELFGDGFFWAGCTLIMVLGQKQRFEILDLCYHALKLYDPTDTGIMPGGWNLGDMMGRVKNIKKLNTNIFGSLERALRCNTGEDGPFSAKPDRVIHFDPPKMEPKDDTTPTTTPAGEANAQDRRTQFQSMYSESFEDYEPDDDDKPEDSLTRRESYTKRVYSEQL